MALRKRNLKVLVTTMALISVVSSVGLNNVYADSNSNVNNTSIERALENKNYIVKNQLEYVKDGQVTEDTTGKIRSNISEDTLIEVKDNKIYMTLEFTQAQYSFIDNVSMTVDGNEYNFERSDDRKYKVEIASLNSDIKLKFDVNVPIPNVPAHTFNVNIKLQETNLEEKNQAPTITVSDQNIYVGESFDANSIVKANDNEDGDLTSSINIVSNNVDTTKAGQYNVTYEVSDSKGLTTTKTISVRVLEKEVVKPNTLENGRYKIKNTTKYLGNSSMGSSMVRNSLKEISYIDVKDGEVLATLEFEPELYKVMESIKVNVDGNEANINEDKNNAKITFKVESINSKIDVTSYITAMGMNISYSIGLEESTIEKVTESTENNNDNTSTNTGGNTNSNNGGSTNGNSSGSSSSESSSSGGSNITESTTKKGKLYTIKNTVDHESQTGKEMARKYLNSTSKVEEIDGQKYVTLTFTGSEFMNNHVIYVNGSKVTHSITEKSGDTISLRFKVSSLSDTIKVGTYVVPMSRNIEFTVKLLEDTLTFVKDYEVTDENGSTLPQTGSFIDSNLAMTLGGSLVLMGGFLNRRKRQ